MFGKMPLRRLAVLSGLLLAGFAPVSASAAQDHFNCRASALRLNLPLGQTEEPVVANPPNNPCASDSQASVSYSNSLGISSGSLAAKTVADQAPLTSYAKIDGMKLDNVLSLINVSARQIRSRAEIKASRNGRCTLHSGSRISGLSAQGQQFDLLKTPMDMNVKLAGVTVGKLHFNATLGGAHPTIGKPDPTSVTQRAVWLQITDPVLQQTLGDVIMGEASAGAVGTPCS
jgi:hypothetical protein